MCIRDRVDDDHGTCEHAMLLLSKMQVQADWTDNGFAAITLIETAKKRGEPFNEMCIRDRVGTTTTHGRSEYSLEKS